MNHIKIGSRTGSILSISEPYEMTYWKAKFNSPFNKLQRFINRWWISIFHTHAIV
jgi:hypothetical protein